MIIMMNIIIIINVLKTGVALLVLLYTVVVRWN